MLLQSLMMAAKGLLQLNFLPESIEIAPHGVGGTGLATLRGELICHGPACLPAKWTE